MVRYLEHLQRGWATVCESFTTKVMQAMPIFANEDAALASFGMTDRPYRSRRMPERYQWVGAGPSRPLIPCLLEVGHLIEVRAEGGDYLDDDWEHSDFLLCWLES